MQAIFESLFDLVYLSTVIALGITMLRRSEAGSQYRLMGIMAVLLGAGDAFHLLPRVLALNTTGISDYVALLGFGKEITSITMSLFYLLLYYVWRKRYRIEGKGNLTALMHTLTATRIFLCLLPQNMWLSADAPWIWGIVRNIPFAMMGLICIILFYRSEHEVEKMGPNREHPFRWMWLTIVLSFAFYLPVVTGSDMYPALGILMIPKTCAYVWTILIGYWAQQQSESEVR